MTALAPERERLTRLLRLVEREDVHLRAVRHQLLGDDCSLDAGRVSGLLSDDAGIDRLESFGAWHRAFQRNENINALCLRQIEEYVGGAAI